ncbi:hypothetical protein Pla110_27200 [Polystyrenella longa]|uniref:DUF1080 domain-containing protein n=1 Tax=Polystyrenella longa TaxID=2528007 RepID=A0A518CP42_9PLAN|nr:hypothetical protein [Polystyrenella longa]QDU80983.1 hypothetical protein Pla110_27200 [Polystyrenella longa]
MSSLSVDMRAMAKSGFWADGFVIFDYVDENNFKYAGYFAVQNQWVMGQYRGHWGDRYASVDWGDTDRDIVSGSEYNISVRIHQDEVQLFVFGELIATADFHTPLNQGALGLANYNARTHFLQFIVSPTDPPSVSSPIDGAFAEYDGSLID